MSRQAGYRVGTVPLPRRVLLMLALLAGLTYPAAAQPLSPDRQREILRDALDACERATAMAHEDPARALELYRRAAAGFHALQDAGVGSAALDYNLGNVYFRLGDIGQAVLHYRRAQRLDPGHVEVAANLRYARDRVEPAIAASAQRRLARQLLFWHYGTALSQRVRALVILSAIGWVLLFVWLWWRRRAVAVVGLMCVLLALAAGASARWQLADEERHPHGVLVGEPQYLRLGRGAGSDLALKQPLGPGVELRVLEQRGDWVKVRLRNDQAGWLPVDAVERV